MNILQSILLWFMEPWIVNAGQFLTGKAAFPMVGRCLVVYIPPIIFGHLVDRYTGYFSTRDTWGMLYLWPVILPIAIVLQIGAFIAKGLDVVVARLSRKILLEDERGRVYSEIAPQTSGTRIKDRLAVYVEVKDHTGTHRIRVDPNLLRNRELDVQEAIAHTFGVDASAYQPMIES